MPETAQLELAESVTNARQMPEPNARQMPDKCPNQKPETSSGFWNQMPERTEIQMPEDLSGFWDQIPDDLEFDTPDTARAELWRLEKDGNYCRWRLRFTKARLSRPGGEITPAIRQMLNERPGKGRHAESRAAAERFRSEVEYLANSLSTSTRRRTQSAKPKPRRASAHRPARRRPMPDVPGMASERELPDVRDGYVN